MIYLRCAPAKGEVYLLCVPTPGGFSLFYIPELHLSVQNILPRRRLGDDGAAVFHSLRMDTPLIHASARKAASHDLEQNYMTDIESLKIVEVGHGEAGAYL
ncbi:hypothetical protein ILYODFUR_029908 [Ilyodon furcidens]|uniref:Uncharacterized protein n=1 Tax=Ilyodon furcidens TaxID=33524 RepID=A0ABV0U2K6_9TELE